MGKFSPLPPKRAEKQQLSGTGESLWKLYDWGGLGVRGGLVVRVHTSGQETRAHRMDTASEVYLTPSPNCFPDPVDEEGEIWRASLLVFQPSTLPELPSNES